MRKYEKVSQITDLVQERFRIGTGENWGKNRNQFSMNSGAGVLSLKAVNTQNN